MVVSRVCRGLPLLVKQLLHENNALRERNQLVESALDAAEGECEEQREALLKASAREEALHEVIRRCRWG